MAELPCDDPTCRCCNPGHECWPADNITVAVGDHWTCECGKTWVAIDPHVEKTLPAYMLEKIPTGSIGYRFVRTEATA